GKFDNGEIIIPYGAVSSADTADILQLVGALLGECELVKDGNIFNIQSITIKLTQEILDSLWGLIFADNPGAKIPVTNAAVTYVNSGFADVKTLGVNVGLGGSQNGTVAGINLAIDLQFGSLRNEEKFENVIAQFDNASVRAEYMPIDINSLTDAEGNFQISALLDNIKSVYVALNLTIDLYAMTGDFTSIEYANDSIGLLLQGLVDFVTTLDTSLVLSVQGNLNLDGIMDANGQLNALALLKSTAQVSIYKEGAAANDHAIDIWLKDGIVYLHTREDILGGINIKLALDTFFGDDSAESSADAIVAEDEEEPAEGGIDILGLVFGILGADPTIKLGEKSIDVYLATNMIAVLLDQLLTGDIAEQLSISAVDDPVNGGVRITLADGLNLRQLELLVYLGIGDNLSLGIELGGFNAALNELPEGVNIDPIEEFGFVDIMTDPYVWLEVAAGFMLTMNAGTTPIGGGGNLVLEEEVGICYDIDIQASLDLTPLIAYLKGEETIVTKSNETQLLIEITMDDALNPLCIGVYYKDGYVFLDATRLGIDKVAIELDLMGLLFSLLFPAEETPEIVDDDNQDAISAAEWKNDPSKFDLAFMLAVKMSSKDLRLEVVSGLVELLWNKVGINATIVDAFVSLTWFGREYKEIADGEEYDGRQFKLVSGTFGEDDAVFAIAEAGYDGQLYKYEKSKDLIDITAEVKNVNNSSVGALNIAIKKIDLAIDDYAGRQDIKPINGIPLGNQFVFDGSDDGYGLISLIELDEEGNIAFSLEQVFLEICGTIDMAAFNLDNDDWTVGEWVGMFLANSDLDAGVKSLIERLIIAFGVDYDVQKVFGFRLAAMLRFNPENIGDISYLLSHSDLSLEVYDGEYEISKSVEEKRIIAVTLLCEDPTAPTLTARSSIYIDGNTKVIDGVHIMLSGLDLGGLLSSDEEVNDADATADEEPEEPAEESDIVGTIVGIIGGVLHGLTLNSESATLYLAAGLVGTVIDLVSANTKFFKLSEEELITYTGTRYTLTADGEYVVDENGEYGAHNLQEEFVRLNPENSFIKLTINPSLAIDISLGIDPIKIGIGISKLHISLRPNNSVESEYFPTSYYEYTSIDSFSNLSLELSLNLTLGVYDTQAQKNKELPINDILSAFIADMALAMGIEIEKDILLDVEVYVGANLSLDNPSDCEIAIELRNNIKNMPFIGIYLVNNTLYLDMGMLSDKDVVIKDTTIASALIGLFQGLLGGDDAESEAIAAGEAEDEALAVLLNLANENIQLKITQDVIATVLVLVIGLLSEDGSFDPTSIERLPEIGLSLGLEIDFKNAALALNIDSTLLSLG
ncbi:MAG: hypothetical protein MJ193_00835, partial [Clostridia bacterium]|nr:hypothetical protein [Clostridia bacterium]